MGDVGDEGCMEGEDCIEEDVCIKVGGKVGGEG